MPFFETSGIRYWAFDSLLAHGVKHGFITRRGGVSRSPWASLNVGGTTGDDENHVRQNHQRIFNAFERPMNSMFDVWQVHGKDVVTTQKARPAGTEHEKADGILTNNHAVTLFMRFADCVPILLVDPLTPAIGIVHAGWKGTYLHIAQRAVEKMTACFGSKPGTLYAGIGPSICRECYQVGREVLDAFSTHFGDDRERYIDYHHGKHYLDLWLANRDILYKAGVKHIENAGLCTACHLDDWYSHRAENGKTGRFAVLMRIADN